MSAAGHGRDAHADLTRCFEGKVAAWFAGEGRRTVADRVYLRQMNMAIALALSRWLEMAEGARAPERMHDWLAKVEERAVTRRASARAEAIRQTREWFDACT